MKTIRLFLPFALFCAPALLHAQGFSGVIKTQHFLQTTAAGAVAEASQPFVFQALAGPRGGTLILPGGGTMSVAGTDQGTSRMFTTQTAMDAAFPSGTYQISGATASPLSFNIPAGNFPADTPQLISTSNGSWGSGNVLRVDSTQETTLNFSTFSSYATAGVAGTMSLYIQGVSDNVNLRREIATAPGAGTVQATPFTSYTIPAGTLSSGRVYRVYLDFGTVSTFQGSLVVMMSKSTTFYILAQAAGTATLPSPTFISQPANQIAVLGGSATFSVQIDYKLTQGGFNGGSWKWFFNGEQIDLSMNTSTGTSKYDTRVADTLTIRGITAADVGIYHFSLINSGGVLISAPATLTLGTLSAPAITAQPRGATVNAGSTVALTVAAGGTPAPTIQWQKNGVAIPGATSDTLVLANVGASAGGNYNAVVTNSVASVVSSTSTIVITSGQPSRLPNLSVRTNLSSAQTLIVGFATTGSKTMLVRGIGPTLAGFGLSGVLPDPVIELYSSAAVKIDENNDWNQSLSSVFSSVGAFALVAGSRDAAMQRACTGSYTAQIKSTGEGVVLVEVYETVGTGKLSNVSARNAVGTGDNILIAGFVVDGTAAKTLLIRGVGAKLAEFGVSGVLADPKLEIYNAASVKIAENDSWNPLLQSIARSVGAFDLTLGSRDAALVITLAPGTYTAQISGVGGTTGEAIVEVYEVP